MNFSEYFGLVRSFLKKRISKDELCMLLFDSVIEPLDLTNAKNDIVSYTAARLNEIVNGKRPVPTQIKENIFEDAVTATIVEYFNRNIVPLLIPNHEDICYQMMQLIEADKSISPASTAQLRILTKPETIAAFLASSFIYAVRYDPDLDRTIDTMPNQVVDKPYLHLVGIHDKDVLNDFFLIESFVPSFNAAIDDKVTAILEQYSEISNIHLGVKPSSNAFSSDSRFRVLASFNKEPIIIKEATQQTIKQVGKSLGVNISDDFFNLGDLSRNPLKSSSAVLGYGSDLEGSDVAKRKYRLIYDLKEKIYDASTCLSIEEALGQLQCIKLGLKNSGFRPDQDIVVTLELEPDSLFTSKDLLTFYRDGIITALDSDYKSEIFGISGAVSYSEYDESVRPSQNGFQFKPKPISLPVFGHVQNDDSDYLLELDDIFFYDYYHESGKLFVSISFDEVMHNSTVAFPTVLFLNKSLDQIRYTIRSRNMAEVYSGVLFCSTEG